MKLNIKICKVLVILITFSCLNLGTVGFAQESEKLNSFLPGGKGDGTMQYNARPIVSEIGLLNSVQNIIAIDFSEAMTVTGAQGIETWSNYLISIDAGKTYEALSENSIYGIDVVDGSRRVAIKFRDSLPIDAAQIFIKVMPVADIDGKSTLNEFNIVRLKNYEISSNSISNITVVNPRTITFNTNFHVGWIDVDAIFCLMDSENKIQSADFKNNVNGALVTLTLSKSMEITPDINNLRSIKFSNGSIFDTMWVYNELDIVIEVGQIKDGISPKLVSSYTQDLDADGHIDSITAVFDENIRFSNVSDIAINFPKYSVASLNINREVLTICLNESRYFDTGNTPSFKLLGKVCDLAGNIPEEAKAGFTTEDKANPVVVSAEITSTGKTKGFGNDAEDAIAIKFSEPIYTRFQNAKAPRAQELSSIFGYIENEKMVDIFDAGFYIAKDMSKYPSNELILMLKTGAMRHPINKGGLLRVVKTYYLEDEVGLTAGIGLDLIRVR